MSYHLVQTFIKMSKHWLLDSIDMGIFINEPEHLTAIWDYRSPSNSSTQEEIVHNVTPF
jgi:hypothetical protein